MIRLTSSEDQNVPLWPGYIFDLERSKVKAKDAKMSKPFLPRDAMRQRGICRHAVSVRPSVTFVNSVKTDKHTFNFFHRQVDT